MSGLPTMVTASAAVPALPPAAAGARAPASAIRPRGPQGGAGWSVEAGGTDAEHRLAGGASQAHGQGSALQWGVVGLSVVVARRACRQKGRRSQPGARVRTAALRAVAAEGAPGVETPAIPGDISIAGDLSADAVASLAPKYKGWLYLNSSDNLAFHLSAIEAAGCACEVRPLGFDPPPTDGAAEAILDAMARLPRPLMVQCSSGKRAGAALLLWLAKQAGHNAASAEQVARDLGFSAFAPDAAGPVRNWVLAQLPTTSGTPTPSAIQGGPVLEQRFIDDGTSTFTYMLGCPKTGEAILIDPVLGQEDEDRAWLQHKGFKLKYVLNTHAHADHVTSGSALRELCPGMKTVIAAASKAEADVTVGDGDKVEFGDYAVEVASTPGHTNGCVSYILKVDGTPRAAFTGDALLIRGCGRTDFQQGDSETLHDSISQKIFTLPGDALVYPGHDYKGRNVSTVAEEKTFNPRLSRSKAEFVELMAHLDLPMPKLINIAVPANMRDGRGK